MTVFWVDIHPTFQATFEPAILRAAGCVALALKVTEGTGWYRSNYRTIRNKALQEDIGFCAYHFLRSESSGDAQARWTREKMGGDWGIVPVMLDWETSVANTWADARVARDYVNASRAMGGKITLNYLPRWYWERIGRPNLALPPFNSLGLVQSSYGTNPRGGIIELYPGDTSRRWASYEGIPFEVLQFGSRCRIPGYGGDLDINAYRGTETQLRSKGWFYWPRNEAIVSPWSEQLRIPANLVSHFPPGVPVTPETEHSATELLWRTVLLGYQCRYALTREREETSELTDAVASVGVKLGEIVTGIAELKRILSEPGADNPDAAATIEAVRVAAESVIEAMPERVKTALREGTGPA